jgi:PAS domain S-box-containing protein
MTNAIDGMDPTVFIVGGASAEAADWARMLRDAGYRVVGTADRLETAAVEFADGLFPPDLVLIDLDRPRRLTAREAIGALEMGEAAIAFLFVVDEADPAACRHLLPAGVPLIRPLDERRLIPALETARHLRSAARSRPLPPAPPAPGEAAPDRNGMGYLQGRESLLEAMFEATPDPVIVKDRNRVYRSANPALCRFLWRDLDGILGRTDADLFPAEQAAAFEREDRRILETGQPLIADQEVIGPRGRQWVNVTKTPIREPDGTIAGIFVGVRDISRRKASERALNEQLRYEQALSACSRILLKDLDGALDRALAHLLEAADASRVYLYRNRAEADGRPRAILAAEARAGAGSEAGETDGKDLFYDDGFHRWRTLFQEGRAVMGSVTAFPDAERQFLSARGARSALLLPVWAERDWHGFIGFEDARTVRRWAPTEITLLRTAAEMIGAFLDRRRIRRSVEEERLRLVDRVAERTRELEAANLELTRAARMKDEFLANMSHELRTPLTAVLGMAEALQDQVYGPLNDKQLRALHTIERSGAHLLDLINDILDVSKIEAGKLELEILPVSIADACESSLRMVRTPAEKKKITLHTRLETETPLVPADERRLKQILVNLLSNAVKFTPEGGMVTLAVREGPDWIRFSVRDTGIGIEPEAQERVFEPFTQLDGGFSRFHDGTGLGLTLVRRLARLHGGELTLNSTPGEGSAFVVALPKAAEKPDKPAEEAEGS